MSTRNESVLGWVRPVRNTEDTILFEYRTPRRLLRGGTYVLLAIGLIGFGFKTGVDRANLIVWLLALIPLVLATVFASWGLLDLITRGLFELEVDRRAKTLSLAMPTEAGQALAKVAFSDVQSVSLVERRPLPGGRGGHHWSVALALGDSRRIGLGMLEDAAEAERLASSFGELLNVPLLRSVHESRQ